MDTNVILHGDNREVLATFPDASIDLILTDVPYGLGTREPTLDDLIKFLQGGALNTGGDFMGKKWTLPTIAQWRECLRVLKPGGHLFTFGGTRSFDLIALGLRAAGFEYRDTLQWIYGEGMPHGLNVSKAIDKADGVAHLRKTLHTYTAGGNAGTPTKLKGGTYGVGAPTSAPIELKIQQGATEKSQAWDDWHTGLKPAWEPILWFQKPLEGTVIKNVLKYCTGAINVGACRISTDWDEPDRPESWRKSGHSAKPDAPKIAAPPGNGIKCHPGGRWPANVLFSHAPGCRETDESWDCVRGCPVKILNEQAGLLTSGALTGQMAGACNKVYGSRASVPSVCGGDSGFASRFFTQFAYDSFYYCAKAKPAEVTVDGAIENSYPTRKPVGIMRWLARLGARPGAIVLDPWCGSGATPIACLEEGMRFIAIDKDAEAIAICRARVNARLAQGVQTSLFWSLQQGVSE